MAFPYEYSSLFEPPFASCGLGFDPIPIALARKNALKFLLFDRSQHLFKIVSQ